MELTTPTGAAILTTVAEAFGPLPAMTIESIGLGAGTKDLPGQANILRLFVGKVDASAAARTGSGSWRRTSTTCPARSSATPRRS